MRSVTGFASPRPTDQPLGILRRRALLVVVEIDEDVAPAAFPRVDVARPCAQRRVRIVVLVAPARSVAAHIDVLRGRDPGRRRVVMVGQAQRHVVPVQEIEHCVGVPARVAEFEGVTATPRQHLQERLQASAIHLEARRQLEQDRPAFRAECLQPRLHQVEAVVGLLAQPLPMGDELGRLPGEQEAVRRLLAPRPHGVQRRRAVERAVDLGGAEAAAVMAEPGLLRHLLGIERPAPAVIGPAGGADMHARH